MTKAYDDFAVRWRFSRHEAIRFALFVLAGAVITALIAWHVDAATYGVASPIPW